MAAMGGERKRDAEEKRLFVLAGLWVQPDDLTA